MLTAHNGCVTLTLLALSSYTTLSFVPAWFVCLLLFWLFAMGSCIGSFMNVVVYRMPLGLSLAYPPSRCPSCLHDIRMRDNIPILGWIVLKGRCRDCDVPIPSRYVWVEFVVGAIFMVYALLLLVPDGISLPFRDDDQRQIYEFSDLWWIYGVHVTLLSVLLAANLIRFDGEHVPATLFVYPSLMILAMVIWEPLIHVVEGFPFAQLHYRWHGPVTAMFGLTSGWMLGALAGLFLRDHEGEGAMGLLGLVGVALGWQAAILVGIISLIWFALIRATSASGLFSWTLLPSLCTVGYLVGWKFWVEAIPWLGNIG